MMKDLRIENLNDFEVVSELIIGVSYLTGEKISSLFNMRPSMPASSSSVNTNGRIAA